MMRAFIAKCQEVVAEYNNENRVDPFSEIINPQDVYVVWSCKTLQNAKVLMSTPATDGMYYELTYNGDKQQIYFDAYKKVTNIAIDVKEGVQF